MAGERPGELVIHRVEKRHQPWRRDERFDEGLMVVDLLPELLQRRRRQIQQRAPIDILERDPIGQVIEGDRPGAQLAGEAGRERPRLLGRPASYHDDELVQLAERFRIFSVAAHICLARRKQVKLGRLECESRHRDHDRGGGEAERHREDEEWVLPAESHGAAQRPAHGHVHR